jgi:transcriptional regulator with XRE-family HTH domain
LRRSILVGFGVPDLPTAFGDTLRKLREKKGYSQMKLAQRAGLHLNALGNIERGERTPSLRTVFLISEALDIPAAQIVGEVEKKYPTLG